MAGSLTSQFLRTARSMDVPKRSIPTPCLFSNKRPWLHRASTSMLFLGQHLRATHSLNRSSQLCPKLANDGHGPRGVGTRLGGRRLGVGAQACNRTSALGGTGAPARGAARTTTEVNALVRSHHASLESHVGWPSSWQTALVGAGFELSWCVAAFSLRMWREVGPECSPERQNAPGTAHKSSERVPACPSEAPSALGLPHLAVTRSVTGRRHSPTGLRSCSATGRPHNRRPGCGHARRGDRGAAELARHQRPCPGPGPWAGWPWAGEPTSGFIRGLAPGG